MTSPRLDSNKHLRWTGARSTDARERCDVERFGYPRRHPGVVAVAGRWAPSLKQRAHVSWSVVPTALDL